jgi:hypothetical protein
MLTINIKMRVYKACMLRTLFLYGDRGIGTMPTALRYKDVCKHNLKAGGFNPNDLESVASNHSCWQTTTTVVIEDVERYPLEGKETAGST